MRSPLIKRIPRELTQDFGKYIAIFMFMIVTIGLISGFIVTGDSMIVAYDNSFSDYHIENGHFVLKNKASDNFIEAIEKEKVSLYEDFYKEEKVDTNCDDKIDGTIRFFWNRDEHNKLCLMSGKLPETEAEIAIDRTYAKNNKIKVGNEIKLGDKKIKVTGFVALSDYSALFSDTTDMMFDSTKFGVGIMTKEGFDTFSDKLTKYSYAWFYDREPKDEIAEKKVSDKLMEKIAENAYMEGNEINNYIPRYTNSAINFTGDDMGSDRTMMIVLLYIMVLILAFIFALSINHTIVQEASVIGTLRASGYTKAELLVHYITLPMIVTMIAAVVGNVLGYTLFRKLVQVMYYGSYSLPTFKVIWNVEAFVLTTVIPLIIMLLINTLSVINALRATPLQLLRHDIGKKNRSRSVKLPDFKFIHRFRIRVILQNMKSYILMFVGIFFACVLLLFGLMMHPLLDHYEDEAIDNMFAKYQYILKAQVETTEDEAEKYCAGTFKITMDGYKEEDATVYGISDNSKYITAEIPEDGVIISDGFAEKYKLEEDDTIVVREAYGKKKYEYKVKGIIKYPATISIFMNRKMYAKAFDVDEDYYNGYFTNKELADIDKDMIYTCIEKDDLTKISRQLEVSMGKMFSLINVFSVVLFLLVMYLLTKLIIERNANAISMVKILGYENREIAGLYLLATTWAVIASIVFGIVLARITVGELYFAMMRDYSGWLKIYYSPMVFVEMFALGIASYAIVALFQFRKIKKVPMDQALKNVE